MKLLNLKCASITRAGIIDVQHNLYLVDSLLQALLHGSEKEIHVEIGFALGRVGNETGDMLRDRIPIRRRVGNKTATSLPMYAPLLPDNVNEKAVSPTDTALLSAVRLPMYN